MKTKKKSSLWNIEKKNKENRSKKLLIYHPSTTKYNLFFNKKLVYKKLGLR